MKFLCITIFVLTMGFLSPAYAGNIDQEKLAGGGGACTSNRNGADWDTIAQCVSSVWQRGSYFFGSTTDTCDTSHAGMMQYTGSALQYCNGYSWLTVTPHATTGYLILSKSTFNGCLAQSIAANGLTCSGTTATVSTAPTNHMLSSGQLVTVSGASGASFNVSNASITVQSATSFTYTIASCPTSPDPGSPAYCMTAGRTDADKICLNEITTNTGWKGYSTANSNGLLVSGNVHALLGDGTYVNQLVPLMTYSYANANDNAQQSGGNSFTVTSDGLWPNDSNNWSGAGYFNTSTTMMTGIGYSLVSSTYTQPSATGTMCSAFTTTSGSTVTIGNTNNTNYARWTGNINNSCASFYHILCFVNP